MPVELEIRRLQRSDDRSGFSCGEPALDRYFRDYAGQNQFKLHVAVTYVVAQVGDPLILGFATVTAGTVERGEIPSESLRKRLPAYPLPVLRLARLGVDRRAQGLGVGAGLLRYVLDLALTQREVTGCVGVLVDAKPPAVAFYERYGFSPLVGLQEGTLHGDPLPMFLSLATVEAAQRNDAATQRP